MDQEFRRVVLVGLHQNVASREAMRIAADLARLLHLEFLAVFLEDTSLFGFADLPFFRELRPLDQAWRRTTAEEFARQLREAARSTETQAEEAARAEGIKGSFEIRRGPAHHSVTLASEATDIIIIPGPAGPLDWQAEPFPNLVTAALRSAASVIIVPAGLTRRQGPVVAIAQSVDDPAIRVGALIAAAAGERLTILGLGALNLSRKQILRYVRGTGLNPEEAELRAIESSNVSSLPLYLQDLDERIIVTTRGSLDEDLQQLAGVRGTPIMFVEPARVK
jgi:hypothetical protein